MQTAMFACVMLAGLPAAYGSHPATPFELDNRDLLLQVWINDRNSRLDAAVTQRHGMIWIDRATLAAAGLRFRSDDPAGDRVSLQRLPGVRARIDEAGQRLLIHADAERLSLQHIHVDPRPAVQPDPTGTGLMLNYDVSASAGEAYGGPTGGATLAATLFHPGWRLNSSGFGLFGQSTNRAVRLDSSLVMDRPGTLRQWVIGDAVSGGLRWSRPFRFAGLHVGTDYALQPRMRTFPLPAFIGSTTVPSSLDIYVNAARVLDRNIASGPYRIDDIPVNTGRNVATLVVRDLLGREQTQTLPFYASDRLLRPGLSDYAFDAGFLRRRYGLRSFDYGAPAAAATFRHGMNRNVTLMSHAEASRDTTLLGGGAAFAIQPLGVLEIDAAGSTNHGRRGSLLSFAASGQASRMTVFARLDLASRHYADVGAQYDIAPPRRRAQLGVSTALGLRGNLVASWIDVDQRIYRTQLMSLTYTRSFGGGAYLGIGSLYDRTTDNWQGQISITVPLGESNLSTFGRRDRRGSNAAGAALTRSANPDGGFGYRLDAYTGDNAIREGQVTWVGQHGVTHAGAISIDGRSAGRLGASGALVLMDGSAYATRRTGDAFALVDAGAPGVPIYREHREIAVTGADGKALVTDLSAYSVNHLSIDPTDYPMGVLVEHPERDVVPQRDSGMQVDLAPRKASPLLLTLELEDGRYPPLGAVVAIEGREDLLVVGRHGQVFLDDAPAPFSGTVRHGALQCRFHVTPPRVRSDGRIPAEGPIPCLRSVSRDGP
ncbi:fimbria/pilus outer membrane usher protein [Oleiagrimonas sp. MCCC 1A03011]|uniref:fimbria/pilus outer membrane usher protein n=1 Tax=Oleiagrimonas sp. MCCC 1A03011 TaxID=1926883 RepID=UPI000DC22B49|nr:fimbria/pilus outer membrane usher protein [Oleiagrimonas sp. MCCC 1A03011]RAP59343.1 hypothetical protein BTJ49_01350 [Oleiagrimonas sp. MCCC 1A03011]